MKLAFIDLDGVVADSTERARLAQVAKDKHLHNYESYPDLDLERLKVKQTANKIFWQELFMPERVSLDTLIEGAAESVTKIEQAGGYQVFYLTSRPASMYDATLQWLEKYNLASGRKLVCVERGFKDGFIKTIVWKAGMIGQLIRLFDAYSILVVDDSTNTLEAIRAAMNMKIGEEKSKRGDIIVEYLQKAISLL